MCFETEPGTRFVKLKSVAEIERGTARRDEWPIPGARGIKRRKRTKMREETRNDRVMK